MGLFTGIALALTAASTITQVVASKKASSAQKKAEQKQGDLQRKAAEGQAEILDYNAAVADLQAQDAIERGAEAESRFRSQVRGTVGAQRAAIAAGNIDVSFGSAVDVQADAAMLGELDALTIRTNAARESWGYKVQATDIRNRAAITRREGVMMQEASRVGTGGTGWQTASTLLGAGASLMQMRYASSGNRTTAPKTPTVNIQPSPSLSGVYF